MKFLLVIVAAVGAFFLWKNFGGSVTTAVASGSNALTGNVTGVLASNGQGSGSLAPEAGYYSSVPLQYAKPPVPINGGAFASTPIAYHPLYRAYVGGRTNMLT